MAVPDRLYERATPGLRPLWHLDAGRTCFIGPLIYNAPHQHGAPVFLAGLYGPFRLRVEQGDWLTSRTAVIPAGVSHELDVGGQPIAVVYVEPSIESHGALATLMSGTEAVGRALIGSGGEIGVMRELWEDRESLSWATGALDDLLHFARPRSRSPLDRRISTVIEAMSDADDTLSAGAAASACGLSPSRFQHLFTEHLGVPFRRYRGWMRMRRAISEVAQGSSLTAAAHAAGFTDQAHFTHDFHKTFGAAPSQSLREVRRSRI